MTSSGRSSKVFSSPTFPTRRIGRIAKMHRHQLTPSELAVGPVMHYSIPAVQRFGKGVIEDGASIDSNKLEIQRRCVLISRLNPRKSTLCIAEPATQRTIASTEFVPLETGSLADDAFLLHALSTNGVTAFLEANSESATRSHQRVEPKAILKIKIPWPSTETRAAIVEFLRHEVREIDAVIEDFSSSIELTEEAVSAAVHEKLRSQTSDIVSSRLKTVARIESGSGFPHHEQGHANEELPFFKVGNLKEAAGGFLESSQNSISRSTARKLGAVTFEPGAVIMAKIGAAMRLNRNAILVRPSCIDNNMLGLTCGPDLLPEFLSNLLSDLDIAPYISPGAIPSLDIAAFRAIRLPLPSMPEQARLVDLISSVRTNASKSINDLDRAITLAKERRAALITAAVTGQIDVTAKRRPAAEQLEDDIKELP